MVFPAHEYQDGRDKVPVQITIENTVVQAVLWLRGYLHVGLALLILCGHSVGAKDCGWLKMSLNLESIKWNFKLWNAGFICIKGTTAEM